MHASPPKNTSAMRWHAMFLACFSVADQRAPPPRCPTKQIPSDDRERVLLYTHSSLRLPLYRRGNLATHHSAFYHSLTNALHILRRVESQSHIRHLTLVYNTIRRAVSRWFMFALLAGRLALAVESIYHLSGTQQCAFAECSLWLYMASWIIRWIIPSTRFGIRVRVDTPPGMRAPKCFARINATS